MDTGLANELRGMKPCRLNLRSWLIVALHRLSDECDDNRVIWYGFDV